MVVLGGGGRIPHPTPPRSHPLPRALLWGALFYLATWLGSLTQVQEGLVVLASPAAGVAALWFLFGSRRTWVWDAPVLMLCVLINSLRVGVPHLVLFTSPFIAVLQVATFVLALRYLSPALRSDDAGIRQLRALRDLIELVAAAAIAGTVSAAATTLVQAAGGLSAGDPRFLLIRWGRNTTTIVVIGAVGLTLAPALIRAFRRRSLSAFIRESLESWPGAKRAEGATLAVLSATLYVLCFGVDANSPLTFLLLIPTAWVGLRFSIGSIAVHALFTGTLAVFYTVNGDGVFGRMPDLAIGAALVQLFVLVISCTGLALGLSRDALATAERESTQHSLMLDSVLAEVDDGIMLLDENEVVLMINPAGRHLLDLDTAPADREGLAHGAALLGAELVRPDGTPMTESDSPSRRALQGEEVRGQEIQIRGKDGTLRRILRTSARVLPAAPDDHGPRKVLVTYHDVTADRRQREALVKFAGEVAHDLKNPLTVVAGWTDALIDEFEEHGSLSSEAGAPMARRVQSAAAHMQDFIGNLLDYTVSRDQALRPIDVDLGDLATRVATLRQDSSADGQPPVITVTGHEHVWADPLLVRVLLDNLVGNAVKYVTPGVRPDIHVCMAALDDTAVEVEITDNGIGITPEERDRIFQTFARVDREGYQGTGLGLAICQRIVQRHGGTISVASAPSGSGTTFSFTLPRTQAAYDANSQA